MIAFLTLLFLTILQVLSGFGLLTLFRIQLRPVALLGLSWMLGIALFSLVPFFLQLAWVPLTAINISIVLVGLTCLLNFLFSRGMEVLSTFRIRRPALYELPALLVLAVLVIVSVWRCFYFPPTPRDLTSGPEVIASYAVREKTFINSVFSVNLESTNNPFKPPFITSLQLIYKYAGFPFGQVWLSGLFLGFLMFLYSTLSVSLHRLLAGVLLVCFVAIPEMYAYTFMALFDYSNAVFFCLSLYFLFRFFRSSDSRQLWMAALLMGLATYIRPETLILAGFIAIAIVVYHQRTHNSLVRTLRSCFLFILPALLLYLLAVTIYLRFYLPVEYGIEGLLRKELWNPAPFFQRFGAMNDQVIFSNTGVNYYGYFIFLFIGLLLIDAIWKEPWDTGSLNWLYGVLVVYAGLPFIAFLFPLFDLDHSTKRGLFKIFPLMLLYMGNSRFLKWVSERIRLWENSGRVS